MRKGGREDHVTQRWRHTHPARPPRHTEILLTWSESPTAAGPKPTGPGRAAIHLEAAKLTEFSRQYRQTRFIGRRWFDNRQDGSAAISNTQTDAYERLTSTPLRAALLRRDVRRSKFPPPTSSSSSSSSWGQFSGGGDGEGPRSPTRCLTRRGEIYWLETLRQSSRGKHRQFYKYTNFLMQCRMGSRKPPCQKKPSFDPSSHFDRTPTCDIQTQTQLDTGR